MPNPESSEHFLKIAEHTAQKSNCVRRNVGCVLVENSSVVASGWNGVHISPTLDCVEAGCPRCKESDTVTGIGYDRCLCVHAEQVAIAEAARNGVSLEGAILYNTLRPCLNCAATALIAGVRQIIYQNDWHYADGGLEEAHARLRARFENFTCESAKPSPLTHV